MQNIAKENRFLDFLWFSQATFSSSRPNLRTKFKHICHFSVRDIVLRDWKLSANIFLFLLILANVHICMEKSIWACIYIISFYLNLNLRINAVYCAHTRNIPNCFYRREPRHIFHKYQETWYHAPSLRVAKLVIRRMNHDIHVFILWCLIKKLHNFKKFFGYSKLS